MKTDQKDIFVQWYNSEYRQTCLLSLYISGIPIYYEGGLTFLSDCGRLPKHRLLNNSKTLATIPLPILYNTDYIFLLERKKRTELLALTKVREIGFQYYQFFCIQLFILQISTEYTPTVREGGVQLSRKLKVLPLGSLLFCG